MFEKVHQPCPILSYFCIVEKITVHIQAEISSYRREIFYTVEKQLKRNGMFHIQLKEEKRV